jgi:hypothetical protein
LNQKSLLPFCNSRFSSSIQRRRIRGELGAARPNSADDELPVWLALLPIEVI